MRHFLVGLAALALIAPACAQDGPHSHPATDAVNASQDAEIAKALSADAAIVEGMADLDRRIDALEAATAGLSSSTADLAARVKALEDAAAPDPDPVPDPDPTPDPPPPPPPPSGNVLTIDATKRFQTINGWSVTTRAWEQDKVADKYDPSYIEAAPEMVADLVNEVGVNRIRVEIQSGAENPVDYWSQFTSGALTYTGFKAKYYSNINDNADPFVANAAGFQWSQLDEKMDHLVMPLRAALAAKGEKLWINLNVVDFGTGDLGSLSLAAQPEEYAELVVEAFKHLKAKYGVTPDSLEMILEPDNGATYTGAQIGAAIKATKARMTAAGFAPQIIAPSTMKASASLTYYDAIKATGVKPDVLAYHTYGTTDDATVSAIGAKGAAEGIQTAMLEKIDAGVDQLHRDLTLANASAWLQWGMASKADNGNNLLVGDPTKPVGSQISMGSKTRGLAQIWRHVRRGYVRVGTSTNFAGVKALAFEAPGGSRLAVGITTVAKNFAIAGLPAGSYAVEYTTASALSVKSGPFTVAAGASLPVSIPAAGVLVAYPVGGSTPPPPPPPDPDPDPTPIPGPVGNILPNTADGLPITTLVFGHHREFQAENPYKNTLLLADFLPISKVDAGEADQATGRMCLNAGETYQLGFVRPTQQRGGNPDPGKWLVKGRVESGTWTIGAVGFVPDGAGADIIRASRVLGASDTGNIMITVSGGASGGCGYPIFTGPEKYEFDTDTFRPEFIAEAAPYKVGRFLDYQTTNGSRLTNADEHVRDTDYTVFSGTNDSKETALWNRAAGGKGRAGYQFGKIFELARVADIAAWIHIPMALGGEDIKPELAICKTPIIDTVAANWNLIEPKAKIEARKYARMIAQSMKAQAYPDNKVLIVEVSNETWNGGTSAFACTKNYLYGVGKALTGTQNHGVGLGRLTAIYIDAFREVFAVEKPQQALVFTIGVQTASFSAFPNNHHNHFATQLTADEALFGRKFREDVMIGVTGYTSGGFQWNPNRSSGAGNPFGVVIDYAAYPPVDETAAAAKAAKAAAEAAAEAQFNAAFAAADADGTLFKKIRDWNLGQPTANPNATGNIEINRTWRDWAVAKGFRGVMQYEGSDGNIVGSKAGQLLADYPQAAQTWQRWIKSPEAYDVQEAIIKGVAAIDPMNPAITSGWTPRSMPVANYQSVGILTIGAPWQEKTGDELGVCPITGGAGAWCKYLRP